MRPADLPRPPRIGRALWSAALVSALGLTLRAIWPAPPQRPPPESPRQEKVLKIVRLSKLPKPPKPPAPPAPQPGPQPPKPQPPALAKSAPRPPRPQAAPLRQPALPSQPAPALAAEASSVKGVPLRVMIPSDPQLIGAHLAAGGGCLLVSRLHGETAEPLAAFAVQGGRALQLEGGPCGGVPRLLRSAELNLALGDPLGAIERSSGEGGLVLQIVLSPSLYGSAQAALARRFGGLAQEELGLAAERAGYQLRCFAEPAGAIRCE